MADERYHQLMEIIESFHVSKQRFDFVEFREMELRALGKLQYMYEYHDKETDTWLSYFYYDAVFDHFRFEKNGYMIEMNYLKHNISNEEIEEIKVFNEHEIEKNPKHRLLYLMTK